MTRRLAQLICTTCGLGMFILFFLSNPFAKELNQTMLDYWQIIFAFALIVGAVGYVKGNVVALEKGSDRLYRFVGLAGMFSMPILAMIWGTHANSPFMWLFENAQAPMQSTVFALLAFFVASASLRGFRARSAPALVLLISAFLVLFSRSTLGSSAFDSVTTVADWLRNYPSMAARRAILIGIGLGSLTTSLRVIVGIERTWLGGSR